MNCQSCGMPMAIDADHGGGRPENLYCAHCTDASGNLKSRQEVTEGMIAFYMQSMGKPREEAEREVEAHMAQMPAWQVLPQSQVNSAPEPVPMTPVTPPVEPTVVPVNEPPAPVTPEVSVPPASSGPAPVVDQNPVEPVVPTPTPSSGPVGE